MSLKNDRDAYLENINAIAESGDYMRPASALRYVDRVLREPWESIVGADDREPSARFGMTETDILIVHFFGAAVLRHGTKTLKRRALTKFASFSDKMAGVERRGFRAVGKNEIARCIGRSRSAVDASISKMRRNETFNRLCFPLFVPTGIMLDVATTRQIAFSFGVDDYTVARAHADNVRIAMAPTLLAQREHCSEALRSKFTVSMPHAQTKAANSGGALDVAV